MSQKLELKKTFIKDLYYIENFLITDSRGFFKRLYCENEIKKKYSDIKIAQINQSFTKKKYSIRGMHFQRPPFSEKKIVTCTKGEIYDVAVDIRSNSKTFLKWFGINLTEKNNKSLIIPEGFAHGFQTLVDDCELIYFHSNFYNPKYEGSINPFETRLAISWPGKFSIVSEKDIKAKSLKENYKGIKL